MPIQSNIEKNEPMVRVGIVLPEDAVVNLEIHFPDPAGYFLEHGEVARKLDQSEHDFTAEFDQEHVALAGSSIKSQTIIFRPTNIDSCARVRISGLTAGRGFHWQKPISAIFEGTIELSILDGGSLVVNEIHAEKYIQCVNTSEMSATCPAEFLKAHAVIARSWLLAAAEKKHTEANIDVCNDDCCQRYQGFTHSTLESIASARDTWGEVLVYDNEICDTRYSKSCGGITERCDNVWDMPYRPYLSSVSDTDELGVAYCSAQRVPKAELKQYMGFVDEQGDYFRWVYTTTQAILLEKLQAREGAELRTILDLVPIAHGESGRILKLDIQVVDATGTKRTVRLGSEYEIRDTLGESFLYSSAFDIAKEGAGRFVLTGKGWGHGAGLCQIGALGMALAGKSYHEILTHYYTGADIRSMYLPG